MAVRKRKAVKKTKDVETVDNRSIEKTPPVIEKSKPVDIDSEYSLNRCVSASIGKTINVGNFESVKISTGYTCTIKDSADMDSAYLHIFDKLENLLSIKTNQIEKEYDLIPDNFVADDVTPEKVNEKKEKPKKKEEKPKKKEEKSKKKEPVEEVELTEVMINKMTKSELIKVIQDEELEIATTLRINEMRLAILDELFEEVIDDFEDDDDLDDDDLDDDDLDDDDLDDDDLDDDALDDDDFDDDFDDDDDDEWDD